MRPGSGIIKSSRFYEQKLSLSMAMVALSAVVMIFVLLAYQQYKNQIKAIETDGKSLINLLSTIPQEELLAGADHSGVLKMLQHQIKHGDLRYWAVLDPGGQIVVSAAAPGFAIPPITSEMGTSAPASHTQVADTAQGKTFQDFQAPLLSEGRLLGRIRIGYASPRIQVNVSQIPTLVVPILVAIFFIHFLVRSQSIPTQYVISRLQAILNNLELLTADTGNALPNCEESFNTLEKRLATLQAENDNAVASAQVLSYQRREQELVLQAIPYAIVIMDEEGKATFANAKTETLLGISTPQIAGLTPQMWCNNSELTGLLLKHNSNIAPIRNANSLEFSPVDNPTHTLEASIQPLFQPDSVNDFLGTLAVFRDVSREVNARQGRDEFISHVAHELKSPLNIIHMFVDMLLSDESLEREQKIESLNSINDQTERVTTLVSNLLSITKIESGTLSLVTQRVNTKEFLKDTFTAMAKSGQKAGIKFNLKLPNTLSSVHIDKELFRVALNNLLSNAIKYNRPGGTVRLRAEETEENFVIRILDNGIGIDADDQGQIFEKFFRSDSPDVIEKNGQGLGLALVKQIVDFHHGTISLKSEKGNGSEFTITLKKTTHLLQKAV